jgi:hypothetical protein
MASISCGRSSSTRCSSNGRRACECAASHIRAQNAVVGGVVKGNITAKGRVELGPRARVEGDITSTTLAIAEGAVFIWALHHGGGGRPGPGDHPARPTDGLRNVGEQTFRVAEGWPALVRTKLSTQGEPLARCGICRTPSRPGGGL